MARSYAGVLGPLALVVSLAHGFIHTQPTDAVLLGAWCSLLAFAAGGYVVGWIADRAVRESVSAAIEAELTRERPAEPSRVGGPAA